MPQKNCWEDKNMPADNFIELSKTCYVSPDYAEAFRKADLADIAAVFKFTGDENLVKENLASHRSRIKFKLPDFNKALYLKRYNHVPPAAQIKNWLCHRRRASTAAYDCMPGKELLRYGISTPKTVAFGEQWAGLFEKRSFMIMEEIEGHSLEEKLPACFYDQKSANSHRQRCEFIAKLADFVKAFHDTGFRHRDLYLCHIFFSEGDQFHLIDMHRAFKPQMLAGRYRLKDLTQLHYSAPGRVVSLADRLRFYLRYCGKTKLDAEDRRFLRKVKSKAWRMALHDMKHSRPVPFAM